MPRASFCFSGNKFPESVEQEGNEELMSNIGRAGLVWLASSWEVYLVARVLIDVTGRCTVAAFGRPLKCIYQGIAAFSITQPSVRRKTLSGW